MSNITKLKFLKANEFPSKDRYSSDRELAVVAMKKAIPLQCKVCIKRKGCGKRGDEAFCLDWERD